MDDVDVRVFGADDTEAVVALSLEAWAPVFASLREALGPRLFELMHTDWRADQRKAVEEVLADDEVRTWVAVIDDRPVGFTSVKLDDDSRMGELYMIAVDPSAQNRGIGTMLTRWSEARMAEAGMTLAMIDTGGDPGHAPARRAYEKAGFTLLPIARYFKAL
ncbi:MAG: GNAT family N-acetyltransferase [Actinomycetota bacterium]|nr:GNAT family N-acetyltransferase [Actinomycetota bacterium]